MRAVTSRSYAPKLRALENTVGLLAKAGLTVSAYVLADTVQMMHQQSGGYRNESFVAACLLVTWKRHSCLPLGIRRYCKIIVGDDPFARREIVRYYRLLSQASLVKQCNLRPEIYVDEISKTLGVPARTRALAMRNAAKAVELRLHVGRSPVALAAAIVYVSCIQHFKQGIVANIPTQLEIARVSGCQPVALRSNAKHVIQGFAQERWRRRGTALF